MIPQLSLSALPAARAGQTTSWPALDAAALPWALIARAREHGAPVLVITDDEHHAYRLEAELRFYAGDLPIRHFPDPETLPYDVYSPHQDLVSDRLGLLHELPQLKQGIVVTSPGCLLQRLPPRQWLGGRALQIATGDALDLDAQRKALAEAGYSAVSEVNNHGEFAVRGSILDIYPMGEQAAYRIDLFDDVVDSIRLFDPDTQRSGETIDSIRMLPTREVPLDKAAIEAFRERYRERFPGDIHRSQIYADISSGVAPGGIEYYLPLFFEHTNLLTEFLPDTTLIVQACADTRLQAVWDEIEHRYDQRGHDIERPLLRPDEVFIAPVALQQVLAPYPRVAVDLINTPPPAPHEDQLQRLLETHPEERLLFVAQSAGRREQIFDALQSQGITPKRYDAFGGFAGDSARIGLAVGALEAGVALTDLNACLITESDIFGHRPPVRRRRKAGRDAESLLRDLSDLKVGAPIVHRDHGIGIYQGLTRLAAGGIEQEFLTLEYKGGDKIYVPVTSLNVILRYTGAESDNPPLHSLGSDRWQKTRERAAKRVRDVAAELLDLHARRAARPGQSLQADPADYARFCQAFPFTETEDQLQAIEQVLSDLAAPTSMDRVVCGDVGFGKTEVALRAAFTAVAAGKQVCVLAPTTLLARQHLQTFADRFADWPVRIEGLSRLKTGKQQTQILQDLAEGKVDVIVGTHRLLQSDIRFGDLGLVIIDEEQRFGVRHKERMKALRAEVDLLTLTATPIPRTLHMSLSGMRDMSIIATPPTRRLAIKTFIGQWEPAVIREACQREIKRGGQIYFLHNRVEDINRIAREVQEIVPEARIAVAHGQMHERDLEQVMLDFYHNRFNLLVCTTIIESGIDIPNANTIVINRADQLGLAQLHQLRGRVGRSHHRAYAHLLVPDMRALSKDAEQRLAAIETMGELGAGFQLATHDLEIRGAGELLGAEQSGQIQEIGFALYTEMLNRAVRALKTGELDSDPLQDHSTEVDLGSTALLPEDYIADVHTRLILYKRISNAETAETLRELQVELIDRFGLLPEPATTLLRLHEVRIAADGLGINRIEAADDGARIHFGTSTAFDPTTLIGMIQSDPRTYRLKGQQRLDIQQTMLSIDDRARAIMTVVSALTSSKAPN